jgi:hypothetical protein
MTSAGPERPRGVHLRRQRPPELLAIDLGNQAVIGIYDNENRVETEALVEAATGEKPCMTSA